jgi:hypothetical protein
MCPVGVLATLKARRLEPPGCEKVNGAYQLICTRVSVMKAPYHIESLLHDSPHGRATEIEGSHRSSDILWCNL